MTARQAKYLLQFVPRDKFITGAFTNERGKCCAVGHLVRLTGKRHDYSVENCSGFGRRSKELSIYTLVYKSAKAVTKNGASLAGVNNDDDSGYQQDHPKDRVMALLDDMIASGF